MARCAGRSGGGGTHHDHTPSIYGASSTYYYDSELSELSDHSCYSQSSGRSNYWRSGAASASSAASVGLQPITEGARAREPR